MTLRPPPEIAPRSLAHLLAIAQRAALAGGDQVGAHFPALDTLTITGKAPGDYVSDADLASEAAIRRVLSEHAPDHAVLGEEGGGPRTFDEPTWLVDPLDGTTNFVRGLPMVGVSVALVVGGTPVVGVVHAPMLGLTFSAALGQGAHLDGRRLSVSARPVAEALCGTGFPPRVQQLHSERFWGTAHEVLTHVEDLRRIGSSALDLAWTAAGVLDGFFHLGLGPWDVAAGALLVREAGGVVTDWAGHPDAWLGSGDIVAGSPVTHDTLIAACRADAST